MWHWDQGRMAYFQFEALRKVARFLVAHPWTKKDANLIKEKTGLEFAAPATHSPWRNYVRTFKLCLLMSDQGGTATPTPVAEILAQNGATTCDEYLHFIIQAATDPSPALKDWDELAEDQTIRHPLCFSLKYLLAKVAILNEPIVQINEVIGAYMHSGFNGGENDRAFHKLLAARVPYADIPSSIESRQARESIKFMSQLSYMHCEGPYTVVSLDQQDAHEMFQSIAPIVGPHEPDGNAEIQRLATFFIQGQKDGSFEHRKFSMPDVSDLGFSEGTKVVRTHYNVERNTRLRDIFFKRNPTATCDACALDTHKKYPWTKHILDLHHILPLSSGTRVDSKRGTLLSDLVPICPTCHRAVHRFYDKHLRRKGRKDFVDENEARVLYARAKGAIATGGASVH